MNVVDGVVEKLTPRQQQIIKLITEEKKLSAGQLSKILEVNDRTIQRDLAQLKSLGIIKRVGADKGGYWLINDFKKGQIYQR